MQKSYRIMLLLLALLVATAALFRYHHLSASTIILRNLGPTDLRARIIYNYGTEQQRQNVVLQAGKTNTVRYRPQSDGLVRAMIQDGRTVCFDGVLVGYITPNITRVTRVDVPGCGHIEIVVPFEVAM